MGTYVPYVRFHPKDNKKLRFILDNNIPIDGLMIDLRRLLIGTKSYIEPVIRLIEKYPSMILLVDPRTDSFQSDRNTRNIISSLKRIYKLIGIPASKVTDDKLFTAENINKNIELLTDKIIEHSRIHTVKGTIEPTYIIPPYFIASSIDNWYKLTLRALDYVIKKFKRPILAPIAINVEFLSNIKNVEKILDDYLKMNVDGYIILPYELDEYRSSFGILYNLAYLAMELKKTGRKVFIHSSEFGTVLLSLGIDGIIGGMCVRRTPSKPFIIDGVSEIGQVENHIYVYRLFNKLIHYKFIMILQTFPEVYQCECPICKYHEDYLELPETVDYDGLAVHYVFWKNQEARLYSNNPDRLINDLNKAKEIIDEYNTKIEGKYFFLGSKRYEYRIYSGYISNWLKILETFGQRDSINL